jgi:hypothetical protein
MPILEVLSLELGTSIAKALFKLWLKDNSIASEVSSTLADIIKSKTSDLLLQRRTNRQFEAIGEKVAEDLLPLFEEENRYLSDDTKRAVALAVASLLDKTELNAKILASQNLDSRNLSEYLLSSSKSYTVGFSEQEEELFERTIVETSRNIVNIASSLPAFSEQTLGEILRREDLLTDIANRILKEVKNIRKSELNYFMGLDELLVYPGFRFPRLGDFKNNLVYCPEQYFDQVMKIIETNDCCLLTGRSASGKTVLSIAIAKKLLDDYGYRQVYYVNANRAQRGDGRAWYQQVLRHCNLNNNAKCIYIIDNCHLALEEAGEFYFQWSRYRPLGAQIIFVARPSSDNLPANDRDDFYVALENMTFSIEPEDLYWGILEKFASYCTGMDISRYMTLTIDDQQILYEQHSHNLIVSKSRLEAWKEVGGRLSEVSSSIVYQRLVSKFNDYNNETFRSLCALWQFEIPAHNTYVETQLNTEELEALKSNHILNSSLAEGYGIVYYLNLHPDEAKEIFFALFYARQGKIDLTKINVEIIKYLKKYLLAAPPNYLSVYDHCFKSGQKNIELRLLSDADVQEAMPELLINSRCSDVGKYLFNLAKIDRPKAMEFFWNYVYGLGLDDLCTKLMEPDLNDIQFTLNYFQRVDIDLTNHILDWLGIETLSRIADSENLYNITWTVQTLRHISKRTAIKFVDNMNHELLAQKISGHDYVSILAFFDYLESLSYTEEQIRYFVDNVDVGLLVANANKNSHKVIFDLIKKIRRYSPRKYELFAQKAMFEIAERPPYINWFFSISLIAYLKKRKYSGEDLRNAINHIDAQEIAHNLLTSNFYKKSSFIKKLYIISPLLLEEVVSIITPQEFHKLLRDGKFVISTYKLLAKTGEEYMLENLQSLTALIDIEDARQMISLSSLREIGDYFHSRHDEQKKAWYEDFSQTQLKQKIVESLHEEALGGIAYFINKIIQIPDTGLGHVRSMLAILVEKDMVGLMVSKSSYSNIVSFLTKVAIKAKYDLKLSENFVFQEESDVEETYIEREEDRLEFIELQNGEVNRIIINFGFGKLAAVLRSKMYLSDSENLPKYLSEIDELVLRQQITEDTIEDAGMFLYAVSRIDPTLTILALGIRFVSEIIGRAKRLTPSIVFVVGILSMLGWNNHGLRNNIDFDKKLKAQLNADLWTIISRRLAGRLTIYMFGLDFWGKEGFQLIKDLIPLEKLALVLENHLEKCQLGRYQEVYSKELISDEHAKAAQKMIQELLFIETIEKIDKLSKRTKALHHPC